MFNFSYMFYYFFSVHDLLVTTTIIGNLYKTSILYHFMLIYWYDNDSNFSMLYTKMFIYCNAI